MVQRCHNHQTIRPHETKKRKTSRSGLATRRVFATAEARINSGPCLCIRPIKPIEQLVPVSCTHYCASTPGLSTWWSSTVLKRILVSRGASRLDAFSGYPVRTWLPGGAAGATTGTLEVRPPRSSRTRGSSSQDSNTHGR